MLMYKRRKKQKKLKIKYLFDCDSEVIFGYTDDPCRTVSSLWTVFDDKNKKVFIDIDNTLKNYNIRRKSLQLLEINYIKTYKYLNKSIERNEFLLHLKCDK